MTTKTSHTLGPWRTSGVFEVVSPLGSVPTKICTMDNKGKSVFGDDAQGLVAQANARLIAAAPELLDAIIELVNKLDEMSIPEITGRIPYTETTRIGKAKAAIAKAKGLN